MGCLDCIICEPYWTLTLKYTCDEGHLSCKNIPSSQVLLLYIMAYHLPVCIDDGNYNSIISMFHVSLTVRYMKHVSCISHCKSCRCHHLGILSSLKLSHWEFHCFIAIVYEILTTFRNAFSCSSSIDNLYRMFYGLQICGLTWFSFGVWNLVLDDWWYMISAAGKSCIWLGKRLFVVFSRKQWLSWSVFHCFKSLVWLYYCYWSLSRDQGYVVHPHWNGK